MVNVPGHLPAISADRPLPRTARQEVVAGETIERLVTEYRAGSTAADLGRRNGIAKTTVLRLIRQSGESVRHPRFSAAELTRLVELSESGLSQKDISERLGRARVRCGTACGGWDWGAISGSDRSIPASPRRSL